MDHPGAQDERGGDGEEPIGLVDARFERSDLCGVSASLSVDSLSELGESADERAGGFLVECRPFLSSERVKEIETGVFVDGVFEAPAPLLVRQ